MVEIITRVKSRTGEILESEIPVEIIGKDEVKTIISNIRNGQVFTAIVIDKDNNEKFISCRKLAENQIDFSAVVEIRTNGKRYMVGMY